MAQGSLGVLFNNISGKAGSVVFSRSKDGTVIRPRVTARNPRTAAQWRSAPTSLNIDVGDYPIEDDEMNDVVQVMAWG